MRSLLLTAALAYGDYCFSEPGGVQIRIALDGDRINVNAASTAQWVGVGVPKNSNYDEMGHGNFVMGGANAIYERNMSMDNNGKPDREVQLTLPSTVRITTSNGLTNMSFSRLLAPPGGNAIDPNRPLFLWAAGSINSAQNGYAGFNYHGRNRGHFYANFQNGGNCAPLGTSATVSAPATAVAAAAVGKGKAKGRSAAKAKAKGKAQACTAGRTLCTPEIQRMGMNCAIDSCVTVPNGMMAQPNMMGGKVMPPMAGPGMMGPGMMGPGMMGPGMMGLGVPPDVVTIAQFVPYPGTSYNVLGAVYARFNGTAVSLQYDLKNVDARCTQTTSAANSCGLHIHVGRTCSNNTEIAGHYYGPAYNATTDPWANISYRANSQAAAVGTTSVEYGARYNSSVGRAVIVHDQNGTRMACALIPALPIVVTVTNFVRYPGTTTPYNVAGSVVMKFVNATVSMDYALQGVDPKCVRSIGVANSCGLHIHVGRTCSNATEIAGHFYDNSTGVDPWLSAMYVSDNRGLANGATTVTYGYNYDQSVGRAVIVHDQNGTRLACAQIPQSPLSLSL